MGLWWGMAILGFASFWSTSATDHFDREGDYWAAVFVWEAIDGGLINRVTYWFVLRYICRRLQDN
jgi:hypothetical protein